MEGAIEKPDLIKYKFSLAVIHKIFGAKKGLGSNGLRGTMFVLVLRD
jgi:hypothetical protein